MKLPKSVQIKDTVSLFANKYKYKIVLVCPGAGFFRGNKLDYALEKLTEIKLGNYNPPWFKTKSSDDLEYCFSLQRMLSTLSDYEIRIEHPLLNFYTNTTKNLEKLASLDENRVKYVCLPSKTVGDLEKNTVVVKKLDYKYKVHLGSTKQVYTEFVNWSENNNKIRLTKSAKRDLNKSRSWGGSYFYVKDDKTMTMVRMFLGSVIVKLDTVVKG